MAWEGARPAWRAEARLSFQPQLIEARLLFRLYRCRTCLLSECVDVSLALYYRPLARPPASPGFISRKRQGASHGRSFQVEIAVCCYTYTLVPRRPLTLPTRRDISSVFLHALSTVPARVNRCNAQRLPDHGLCRSCGCQCDPDDIDQGKQVLHERRQPVLRPRYVFRASLQSSRESRKLNCTNTPYQESRTSSSPMTRSSTTRSAGSTRRS
jgi:hypothetical protein